MERSHRTGRARLLSMSFTVVLGACAAEAGDTPPLQAPPAEAAVVDEGEPLSAILQPPQGGAESVPVVLEAVGGSGVEGRAVAIPHGDSVQLNVMVQGLPSEGQYAAHVHAGRCAEGGQVVVTLAPVHGESDGMGRSSTTFPAPRLPSGAAHFVQVHGPSGVLACGDMHGR